MSAILSVVMLAALALVAGAVVLWRRGIRKQASLMLVLAVVMLANVLVWALPDDGGPSPIESAAAVAS